ncbi:MAG: DUF4249 domain-containing protein [Bacteroidota bacterium]|nr:DUF4249 domain-containing protein [Bacteroidota bacterium]
MRNLPILLLIVLLIIMGSCTKFINVNLGSMDPQLIVEGVITTDTMAHKIILKRTADYFSNQKAERISDAIIMLSDSNAVTHETHKIQMKEDPDSAGIYMTPSNYFGVKGRIYTINISNVDANKDGISETYTASCKLNSIAPVDSFTITKRKMVYEDAFVIQVYLKDPPEETNYYLFRVWKNDSLVTDSIILWNITDDNFFSPEFMTNDLKIYLFPRFRHKQYIRDNNTVKLEACGITKDYFNFIREAIEAYRGQNPMFGSQPANIRTNVIRTSPPLDVGETGARGYFAAYSVFWKKKIYKAPK